jgi:very-short-patch-repair endonuclease
MTKNDILNKFIRKDGRLNSAAIRHIKNDDVQAIKDETEYIESVRDLIPFRLKAIQQNLTNQPICESCGKPILELNEKRQIKKWCDNACYWKSNQVKGDQFKRDYIKANSKRKATMIQKYGVEYNSQRNNVKLLLGQHCSDDTWKQKARERGLEQFDYIDRDTFTIDKLAEMNQTMSCPAIANIVGCSPSYVHQTLTKAGIAVRQVASSKEENTICQFLDSIGIEYRRHDRSIINPKEVDIFIPEYSLAIEVNGLYWHSELNGIDSKYHLWKTDTCKQTGVRLLHFWDFEVNNKLAIVKSMISSILGGNSKLYARNCKVIEVEREAEKKFISDNHLYGYTPSSICIGLEFANELVMVMSFRKPRFSKIADYEILRLCSKNGVSVVGGASRLFSRRPSDSIVTYADRRFSDGKVYEKLGMNLVSINKPAYHYTKDYTTLMHRMKFQKHKLPAILESFDCDRTEWQNMQANGFDRVWDCGTLSFLRG